MKKISFTILSFIMTLSTVNAQNGIDFHHSYAAGGRLLMFVDSAAKNVYYDNVFPNQPQTSFNYLPEVNNVSVQIYFKKTDRVQDYRYTILEDNKPITVNMSIDTAQLKDVDRGNEEILRSLTLGTFPIKDKTITILTHNVQKPQNVYKNVLYGKPIPRAKIEVLAKRFATEKGVDYSRTIRPKERIDLTFTEKDDELTIVKERSDIDYLYSISIKDKKTGEVIIESTSWLYGGYLNEGGELSPYVKFDKSVFKKSGNYEIIIQPLIQWDVSLDGILEYDISPQEIEKYIARYTLAVTLDQESYTRKEAFIYILFVALSLVLIFLFILFFTRKRNKKKLAQKEQQKNSAKLQLNSIRSQLNPHFMFNALSGIQNLMNKNEVDNANKYLTKFARLMRNVLDDKELINLLQDKNVLDDYLQMEQLRFGFQYEINHSDHLDLDNIEIPNMLLQPFVENAVKHGISQRGIAGKISIEFMKYANDLVLTVADNGKGFDTDKKYNGVGLELSYRRVALLNSIYKENRFILAMQSTTKGTKVELTLKNWV